MRVALVVPFYTAAGGAEKVDDVLGNIFPDADLFALFAQSEVIPPSLRDRRHTFSYLGVLPTLLRKQYRFFLPLYASATESLDLSGYDLVISSERVLAKAILADQKTIHICYLHTPWRQIWDLYRSTLQSLPRPLRPFYARLARSFRSFDFMAAQRVDYFIANSKYIAQRAHKCYGRTSTVIYPPVNSVSGYISEAHADYYLSVGRLSHTKKIDILIQACNRLGRRLIVAGEGREERRLKAIAGPTIEFLGRVSDAELQPLYANCRALLFAADEDFGIVPVEAQSFGRPVIAYGYGGSLETVRVDDPNGLPDTGVYFSLQTAESVLDGMERFEESESTFIPAEIRQHACSFDTSIFVEKMTAFVEDAMQNKTQL